jgi:hypothetical protein
MQMLNIVAVSPESARGLVDALSDFDVELIQATDGGYEVTVTLGASDREIVEVLNALEQYVNTRSTLARLSLNGRDYVMHSEPVA